MSLQDSLFTFKESFNKKLKAFFDERIDTCAEPELEKLYKDLKEYVLAGGKRLRPYLLFHMNEEHLQREGIENILVAFELLHNSTLIDDDIIDEHSERRGKLTLSACYGNSVALLGANLLRGAGLDLIVNADTSREFQRATGLVYQDIARSIDEAQVLDLQYRGRLDLSPNIYVAQADKVAARFIAYMFSLGVPPGKQSDFFKIGRHLGLAFQFADDLMDIDPTKKKGRPPGADIREGAPTLMAIKAYEQASEDQKVILQRAHGNKTLSSEELQQVINIFHKTGAVRYTTSQIKEHLAGANQLLTKNGIPQNHWLREMAEYALTRQH